MILLENITSGDETGSEGSHKSTDLWHSTQKLRTSRESVTSEMARRFVKTEGPELSQWNPTSALKLRWEDKTRKAPSDARAPRKSASPSGTGDDEQQPSR